MNLAMRNRAACWSGPILFLVGSLVASVAFGQLTPQKLLAPTVEEYGPQYKDVESAFKAYNRRNYAQARKDLGEAYKQHPELAPPDVMMALLHLSVGRKVDAQNSIDQAVIENPNDPEAYILLGDLALRDGVRTIAELGYHRGAELMPNVKSNAHRQRNLNIRLQAGEASLAEGRGQFKKAVDHLNKWIAVAPDNPIAYGSLGRVQFRLKDYQAATAAFTKLQQLDANAPPVEIAMGRLYSETGMLKEAQGQMEAAIKQSPDDIRVRLTAAEWALSQGVLDFADENIAATLQLAPNSIGGQVLQARIERTRGNWEQAEKILSAAVLASPNSFPITNELARTLAQSKDEEKRRAGLDYSRRNFQSLKNRNSTASQEALLTFAWLLAQNDRVAEAEAAIAALPSGSTLSKENAYITGAIYAKGEKPVVAIPALEAALSQKGPFPGRQQAQALLDSLTAENK